jgi:hypothetical protein
VSIEQEIVERLRTLPPDKQAEVLAFVESLQAEASVDEPPGSLYGLWANLGHRVSAEDIATARREMWGSFPRDLPG